MAWVKWLKRIFVIDHLFAGAFQAIDYNYYPFEDSDLGKRPVTTVNLDSIIQHPLNLSTLDTGDHEIMGLAWTGEGLVTNVEISTDNGETWEYAKLRRDTSQPYSWVFWSYRWRVFKKGVYTIMARSHDSYGRYQPFVAEWNRKGYGYNAITAVKVKVE